MVPRTENWLLSAIAEQFTKMFSTRQIDRKVGNHPQTKGITSLNPLPRTPSFPSHEPLLRGAKLCHLGLAPAEATCAFGELILVAGGREAALQRQGRSLK